MGFPVISSVKASVNLNGGNFKHTQAENGNEALKPQKSPQHDCCGQNGAIGSYGGAAHREETAKLAGHRDCVPTRYRLVPQIRGMLRRSRTSFPNVVKSAAQISRTVNLQRINCCTFARLLPNRICECRPQRSLLLALFLSCGLCQHTCRCALRHERQANAALTCADQQLCAARADQEGICLTQIHWTVRDTVVFTAHKRQAERHITRPIRNGLNRPETAPYLLKVLARCRSTVPPVSSSG